MPPRKKNQKIFNERLLNLVIIIKGLASNGQGPREKKISSPWRLRQGRQAEVTEAFLCRLIDVAGCSDASDRARFRNYAASRIIMTNAIGVAKTAIANRPISNTNWVIRPRVLLDKIRPETRPFIKPLTKKWRALPHEIMMRALFFPLRF